MKRLLILSTGLAALAGVTANPAHADGDSEPTRRRPRCRKSWSPPPACRRASTRRPTSMWSTRDDLQARGALFADEALATVPGVTVAQTGAFGGVTSVFMRGMSSDQTLVLIDGVPVTDPSQPSGGFDFAALDLYDVKRIEVLTGPQGSLWGSDAMGGVISITTREPDRLSATLEGGSFDTWRGGVSAGVSQDAYAFGASLSGLTSDGIPKAAGTNVDNPFSNWTGALNGRVQLSDKITLDGKLTYDQDRVSTDSFPPPDYALGVSGDLYKTSQMTAYARIEDKDLLGLDQQLSVMGYDILRDGVCGNSAYYCDPDYKYHGERGVVRWTAGLGSADSPYALTFGAERDEDQASLSDGSVRDLGETSAFAVGRINPLPRLSTTLSLRWDDPDSYHSVVTGRAGAVYDLGQGFRLTGTWGQGFKMPTISELACDFCDPVGPDPNLKPEYAQGEDAGLGWSSKDGRIDLGATWYVLDVKDEIEYSPTYPYIYINVDRVRSAGRGEPRDHQAEGRILRPGGLYLYGRAGPDDRPGAAAHPPEPGLGGAGLDGEAGACGLHPSLREPGAGRGGGRLGRLRDPSGLHRGGRVGRLSADPQSRSDADRAQRDQPDLPGGVRLRRAEGVGHGGAQAALLRPPGACQSSGSSA